jgi:hypothetical protein
MSVNANPITSSVGHPKNTVRCFFASSHNFGHRFREPYMKPKMAR